jgi:hypothetical protein
MPRPQGYFYAGEEDGALSVAENDPGLGEVTISWRPSGLFDGERDHEFRISIECWNKVLNQKMHELKKQHAEALVKAEAEKKSGRASKQATAE